MERKRIKWLTFVLPALLAWMDAPAKDGLPWQFANPPDSARPGVYWYFMDGNLSREGMTRDLESMKAAGLGRLIFLEVNVGVPRGPVSFLSESWQDLYVHAVREAERLGIEITLGSGPGWTGSGGPWVRPEQSMQHLVASRIEVEGPGRFEQVLPPAPPRKPFFGDVPKQMQPQWGGFFKDVAVLAFPTPALSEKIPDIDEKALYYRAPFRRCRVDRGVSPIGPLAATAKSGQVVAPPFPIVVSENGVDQHHVRAAKGLRIPPAGPAVVVLHAFHVLWKNDADQFVEESVRLLVKETLQIRRNAVGHQTEGAVERTSACKKADGAVTQLWVQIVVRGEFLHSRGEPQLDVDAGATGDQRGAVVPLQFRQALEGGRR